MRERCQQAFDEGAAISGRLGDRHINTVAIAAQFD
jgi:hypothetical protein